MLGIRFGASESQTGLIAEENSEHRRDISELCDILLHNLRSYESVIHHMQQLLVWEKPRYSVLYVLILHGFFWYLKVRSTHAIGLLATLVLVLIWLDMWKHKIWPEIRAREPDPESDEWGEVHPHLLSLPEICMTLSEYIITLRCYFEAAKTCRKNSPGKFVTLVMAGCTCTFILGRAIPGTLLAYTIMISVCMWPLMWYHKLLERAYSQIEPFLMQLQYSLKPRMKIKGKKAAHVTKEIGGASIEVHTDSSSDDEEMSEFLKPLDAVTAEVFARALTDDDELSESDESLLAHELPSFPYPASNLNKNFAELAEVPMPIRPPQFDDPQFAEEILNENEEDNLGLISDGNTFAKKIAESVAAAAVTNVISTVFTGTDIHPDDKDTNSDSTSSDSDFVILDGKKE